MKYCDVALLGATLRQTPPSQVPQPEYQYYLVLKLLGDILWTTAEAFPEVMLQEQEELERDYMMDVTEDNVDILWRRLTEILTPDSEKNAFFYCYSTGRLKHELGLWRSGMSPPGPDGCYRTDRTVLSFFHLENFITFKPLHGSERLACHGFRWGEKVKRIRRYVSLTTTIWSLAESEATQWVGSVIHMPACISRISG